MTLGEIKKKTYALIEELNENAPELTDDPDYSAKMNYVVNQIQNELARIKKIPAYKEIEVDIEEKEMYEFKDIDSLVYQLSTIRGIDYEFKANGTLVKCLENGLMEVEYFKYPTQIDNKTTDDIELDLSIDVLEIMPYGIAADLLKSDVSNAYGNVYSQRYNQLKQELDIRYNTGTIEFVGGVDI